MGAKLGHTVSEATREKIRRSLTGRKLDYPSPLIGGTHSAEHRQRISDGLRRHVGCAVDGCLGEHEAKGYCQSHYHRLKKYGDPLAPIPPRRTRGQLNHNWVGDDAGYDTMHWRARKELPRQCRACGTTSGRLEVAFLHDVPEERIRYESSNGFEFKYSTDLSDYVRLCVKCHRRYDSPIDFTRAPIATALTR